VNWLEIAKDVAIFASTLLALPLLLLIATLVGSHNPRVRMAVLVVEDLMPNATPSIKQRTAATLISNWLGKFKWIVPIPVINSWIDWEVQILNAEKPMIWKILTAGDAHAKIAGQSVIKAAESVEMPPTASSASGPH